MKGYCQSRVDSQHEKAQKLMMTGPRSRDLHGTGGDGMNPLSAWTFYRRHKRRAAMLLSLIILVTAGLYLMGALVWGVFVEPARLSYLALSKFSVVTPEPSARERLAKVLQLEQEQGYRDRAVIGGLAAYADSWHEQAQRETEDQSWVAQTAAQMQAYSELTSRSERQASLEALRAALQAKPSRSDRTDENGPAPAVIAQIRANPDVARVVPTTFIRTELPSLMPGEGFQFDLVGLMEGNMPYVLERCSATLKEGRLPEPGTNGLLLSEDVAAVLDVKVGEIYDVTSSEVYANMDTPHEATSFEVVGTLESDVRLGIVSLEFLNDHELYRTFPARFLVVAQENRRAAVDGFLRSEIEANRAEVLTLTTLNERIANEALPGLVLLVPPILIVTIAFSLVIVVVNRIANAQRLPEIGILHANGYSKRWLIRRLTVETATLAFVGWVLGIGLSWLVLYLLKVTLFAPRGHVLSFIAWVPVVFALPIPLTLAGFTFISVRRTFSRLDPVAVVERGELSQEGERKREWTASTSSPKPLSSATFYKRHRRRAVLLISAMSLMIVAVVLIIFALAVAADAKEPLLGYLRHVSIVRSPGIVRDLDPGIVAQVKTHPAVERVIPVGPRYHMLGANIPPFGSGEASPFGVYAEDMAYLVELYGLELQQGHLPRSGTNEMVIPEALAQNRDLEVGDVIGDPDHPAYPGASALVAEFVISGIFARPTAPEDDNWWGFVSLEFMESHQAYDIPDNPPLIVVPKAGQKDALDDWLQKELAGADASVLTFRQEITRVRQSAHNQMFAMGLLQSVIAIVAAIALAVLNYIFVSQRQSEFGVLHALGFGRLQLVGRVLWETAFTTGTAWCLSAIIGLMGLLYLRYGLFAPLGLRFSLFDITPWLYTLPIPVAVLAVTGATIARTLTKLDPVSIIERR
jgi:ABC-type lipoprotein release transport system permease subunit